MCDSSRSASHKKMRQGMIYPFLLLCLFLWSTYKMVGRIMNTCVVCAEHDESRPHGWRMATRCIFPACAEHDKSCPYGSRLALLNLFVFCEFYLYHLQLSKKTFIFVTKFHHHIILCSLSPLPRWHHPRNTKRTSPYHLPKNTSPIQTIRLMIKL